jgi:uncharacterized protein (DUF362 family)/Pyruvate/2-oxoacid:ferredoxin oxidoreductase delta subunit
MEITNQVYIEDCPSYEIPVVDEAMVRLLRHMNYNLPSNKTVLVKPNLMAQNRPEQHTITHFSLLDALCRLLVQHDCSVWIADSTAFYQNGLTYKAFRTSHYSRTAKRYGVMLKALDEDNLIKAESILSPVKDYYIPEKVLKADVVINLCKLKTHSGLRLSGAVKNIFGVLPGGYKQYIHMQTINDLELSDVFLDLHEIIRPSLNIMDAVMALDGGPAAIGKPVFLGKILASINPAVLDAVACKMIGYKPADITTLVRAKERELVPKYRSIEIIYNKKSYKNFKLPFPVRRFKSLIKGPFVKKKKKEGIFITDTFVLPKLKKNKCTKCNDCFKLCPIKAITMDQDGYPVFHYENCLSCYLCLTRCPENAIGIKSTLVNKFIRFARKLLGF